MNLRKEIRKHLDLIINCENQNKINASAEKLAKYMIELGSELSYEELLEQLGYREVKVKKKKKVQK